MTLAILEPGCDVCRGEVDVHHVDWDHGRAELGIWVAPAARGRRLARSALRLTARWLLAECGLERVQLLVAPDNEPMLRAAAGAGFTYEGVLRAYTVGPAGRVDAAVLSLIRADVAAFGG